MRQMQQDRSWGDVRRAFMLERRGQVEPVVFAALIMHLRFKYKMIELLS